MRFLLDQGDNLSIVEKVDNARQLPLYTMAVASQDEHRFPPESRERDTACRCLQMCLENRPKASAEFLLALQTMPQWLRDTAVNNEHVQSVLNSKIVQRFPTFLLLADVYFLVIAIACISVSLYYFIKKKSDEADDTHIFQLSNVFLFQLSTVSLIVCGVWFLIRKIIQAAAMANLGTFLPWLFELRNWLNVAVIGLVLYHGVILICNRDKKFDASATNFRVIAVVTLLLLYFNLIIILKDLAVDFAVFVGGLFYVMQRTIAFFIIPVFFLLMFATMFKFTYTGTELCEREYLQSGQCYENFPHCSFGKSLLQSFTMMVSPRQSKCLFETYLCSHSTDIPLP